jgi:hypothetical integral membrane protein (TIGR02206 family)
MNEVIGIIENLPYQHLIFTFYSLIIGFILILIYTLSNNKNKSILTSLFSAIVIGNEIIFQLLLVYFDEWSLQVSLPLEMCYISALIIPFYNYNKDNRDLKNWLFFAGFGGSFFAFINTNLEDGEMVYTFIHYFIAHGLIIIVVISLIIDGYRPKWIDLFKTILWTASLVLSMILINLSLGSNYMFTQNKPPGVTFTELMPEWPYYFLIMLVIGLVAYTLMMLVKYIPLNKK